MSSSFFFIDEYNTVDEEKLKKVPLRGSLIEQSNYG